MVFSDRGEPFCLNCGTLAFKRRAWDLVEISGYQAEAMHRRGKRQEAS